MSNSALFLSCLRSRYIEGVPEICGLILDAWPVGPKQRKNFKQTCVLGRFVSQHDRFKYRSMRKAALCVTMQGGHLDHIL
jgi:hypothetical protein